MPPRAATLRVAAAALLLVGAAATSSTSTSTSTNATLVLLTDAAKAFGAVSLDGSPGALYIKPGTEARKFVILQKGGGWCTSDDDCAARSRTELGSSTSFPPSLDFDNADVMFSAPFQQLSSNASMNPFLYTWTKIFLPYTDGGSQVGDLADPVAVGKQTIYYRGARIRDACIAYLLASGGLADATDVIISGGSAGGLSTYLHADAWAAALPKTARVVGLPDSGYFLEDTHPTNATSWAAQLRWVATRMNGTGALPAACVAANPTDPASCIFAQNVAPFLETPFFALQSTYDAYQLEAEAKVSTNDTSAVNAYGALLSAALYTHLLSNPKHGGAVDSCLHHTRGWTVNDVPSLVFPPDGLDQSGAFQKWYTTGGGAGGGQRVWAQNRTYPCDECCTGGGA
jgi:hypothetical protein